MGVGEDGNALWPLSHVTPAHVEVVLIRHAHFN